MNNNFEISVAPMMDWTNRHCRYFHRLIAPNIKLYTEMITTGALIHGDTERFLRFDKAEHPVALQLGGSDPADLAKCAAMGEAEGFDEINLNCGCPSDRVQKGRFGACLMNEPNHVSKCIAAMSAAVSIPVTVKCRIGVDESDDLTYLNDFVDKVADKNCITFIVHARKAWLKGLSPKQNREVPPLNYERVVALKAQNPHLRVILNGGITDVETIKQFEDTLDGAMIGREAYSNPYFLAEIEREIYNTKNLHTREDIAHTMIQYAKVQAERDPTPIKAITRHILGLYHNQPGAKAWKRVLSTLPYADGADHTVIEAALDAKDETVAKHQTEA